MAQVRGVEGLPDKPRVTRDPGVSVEISTQRQASGAGLAEDVGQLGKAGFNLVAHLQEQRQKGADSAFAAESVTRYNARAREIFMEMQRSAQPGAPDFTKNYQRALESERGKILKSAYDQHKPSDDALAYYTRRVQELNVNFGDHAAVFEDKERRKEHVAGLERSVSALAISVQRGAMPLEDALAQFKSVLEESKAVLHPDDERTLARAGTKSLATSFLAGIAERAPGRAVELLKKATPEQLADWGLDADDHRRLLRGATRLANRASGTARVSSRSERAASYATVSRDLRDGKYDWDSFIEQQERGVIPQFPVQQVLRLKDIADKAEKKRDDTAKAFDMVESAQKGERVLDPNDRDHRKAVDLDYDATERAGMFRGETDDAPIAKRANYITMTGILPETVKNQFNGAWASGDADRLAQGVDLYDRIGQGNRQILRQLPDDTERAYDAINALRRGGMKTEDAVKTVLERRNIPKGERDVLDERRRDEKHKEKNVEFLKDRIGTGERAIGDRAPEQMFADFTAMQREAFYKTRDLASSQDVALESLQRMWGKTRLAGDGERWMRSPPERTMGVPNFSDEQNAAWIREDVSHLIVRDGLHTQIPAAGKVAETYLDLHRIARMGVSLEQGEKNVAEAVGKNVWLVEDELTLNPPPGMPPTYTVMFRDNRGRLQPLIGLDGNRVRYWGRYQDTAAAKRGEAEAKRQAEEAKKTFEVRRRQQESRVRQRESMKRLFRPDLEPEFSEP